MRPKVTPLKDRKPRKKPVPKKQQPATEAEPEQRNETMSEEMTIYLPEEPVAAIHQPRPERDIPVNRAAKRPERVPMHQRNRLSFKGQDPNYMYRVVNDIDDRLEVFKEAGYEFVKGDAKVGDGIVGEAGAIDTRISKPVGGGVRGYLMRIRKEWYDADQADKMKAVEETERAIRPGLNQYVPDGGKQAVTDS